MRPDSAKHPKATFGHESILCSDSDVESMGDLKHGNISELIVRQGFQSEVASMILLLIL